MAATESLNFLVDFVFCIEAHMEVDKVTNMVAEFALMKVAPPSSKISK